MSLQTIDINCDMAEGIGNEAELMPWISSANIACGFHAGNEDLMKSTIELCQKYQVAVGAHPSFPDKENFGRTNMNLPADQIYEMVSAQIHLLKKIARVQGIRVHHVKPHGALYNMAAKDAALAGNIARAVKDLDSTLVFYGLSQSVMIDAAKKLDLRVANEVFADRTYQPDGSLTPRTQPNALIIDEEEAIQQTIRLTKEGKVMTASGEDIQLRADTLCLHGDGKHAVAFAKLIHARLRLEKIKIATIE